MNQSLKSVFIHKGVGSCRFLILGDVLWLTSTDCHSDFLCHVVFIYSALTIVAIITCYISRRKPMNERNIILITTVVVGDVICICQNMNATLKRTFLLQARHFRYSGIMYTQVLGNHLSRLSVH